MQAELAGQKGKQPGSGSKQQIKEKKEKKKNGTRMFNPKRSVLDLMVPSLPQKLCLQTSASLRQVVGMERVRQEKTMEIYTRLYMKDLILSGTFLRGSLNLNRCRRKTAGAGELSVTVV